MVTKQETYNAWFKKGKEEGKKEVFDDFEKEIKNFRMERTGQQEVSMMFRKLKKHHLREGGKI